MLKSNGGRILIIFVIAILIISGFFLLKKNPKKRAWLQVTTVVRDKLINPKSAVFPGYEEDLVCLGDNECIFATDVYSQNALGATVRDRFMGTVRLNGNKWDVENLSFVKADIGSGVLLEKQEQTKQDSEDLPDVTADSIASAYSKNTVAADQQFKGKRFKVSGIVDNINTDIMGNPYITLNGNVNRFMEPQFSFKSQDAAQLVDLEKGSEVKLICVGQGDIAKKPMCGSCTLISSTDGPQLTAKKFMEQAHDYKKKKRAMEVYPDDYEMQKILYQQL